MRATNRRIFDQCDLSDGFTGSSWAPDRYQISADSVINSAIPITSNHAADGYRREFNDPISLNANRSVSRGRFLFAPRYLEAFSFRRER
jgi:hypothetical protein